MKKNLMSLIILVAVLLSQPFLFSVHVMAQAYGGSTYNNGVYNDASSTDPGGEQTSDPVVTPTPQSNQSSGSSAQRVTTSDAEDATGQQGTSTTNEDEKTNNSTDTSNDTDGFLKDEGKSVAEESEPSSTNPLLTWISAGAIVAALALVGVALMIRKARQP